VAQKLAFGQTMRPSFPDCWHVLMWHWAVSVNGNWRMTITFDGTDAVLVDYMDYH
jgi:hypothetical protein